MLEFHLQVVKKRLGLLKESLFDDLGMKPNNQLLLMLRNIPSKTRRGYRQKAADTSTELEWVISHLV